MKPKQYIQVIGSYYSLDMKNIDIADNLRLMALSFLANNLNFIGTDFKFILLAIIEFIYNLATHLLKCRPIMVIPSDEFEAKKPVIVITGATNGIGKALATQLYGQCDLHLPVRCLQRGQELVEYLSSLNKDKIDTVHIYRCDLESISSTRAFISQFKTNQPGKMIDVFVSNAGNYNGTFHQTEQDGIESMFQVHVLSQYILCTELSEQIQNFITLSSSVVNCVSERKNSNKVNSSKIEPLDSELNQMDDFPICIANRRSTFSRFAGYCNAKFLALNLIRDLSLTHPHIRFEAVHPGVVRTNFGSNDFLAAIFFKNLLTGLPIFAISSTEGAATLLWRVSEAVMSKNDPKKTGISVPFFHNARQEPLVSEALKIYPEHTVSNYCRSLIQ